MEERIDKKARILQTIKRILYVFRAISWILGIALFLFACFSKSDWGTVSTFLGIFFAGIPFVIYLFWSSIYYISNGQECELGEITSTLVEWKFFWML